MLMSRKKPQKKWEEQPPSSVSHFRATCWCVLHFGSEFYIFSPVSNDANGKGGLLNDKIIYCIPTN